MMDCLIIGDSIGVGVSNIRTECVSLTRGGINSQAWINSYINRPSFDMAEYETAIISLGSNDHAGVSTEAALLELRATVRAKTVYWIMPYIKPDIQRIILKIASYKGDKIVYIREISKDGIHPTINGYRWLGADTR